MLIILQEIYKMEDLVKKISDLYYKYGIKSVTMDDVARELGISKKTLYQHFKDKDEVVNKVIEYQISIDECEIKNYNLKNLNAIDQLLLISTHVAERYKNLNPAVSFDLKKYYPDLWRKIINYKKDHIYFHFIENMKQGIKEGLYLDDLKIDIITKFYVSRIESVIDPDLFSPTEYEFKEVLRTLFKYHIRGIANKTGIDYLEQRLKTIN